MSQSASGKASSDNTPDSKKYRDKEWLHNQYVGQKKTSTEIASICNCSPQTILDWLEKFEIDKRTRGSQVADDRLANYDWFKQKYVHECWSVEKIASKCDCSPDTVHKWASKHDLKRINNQLKDYRLLNPNWLKEMYVEKRLSQKEIADMCEVSQTTVSYHVNKHDLKERDSRGPRAPDERLKNKEWLYEEYIKKEKTTVEIAKECSTTDATVGRYLRHHNIELRNSIGVVGEDHPMWNGGESEYGDGWTPSKRKQVRQRDDYSCRRCGLLQKEHEGKHDEKLHVHHIKKAREIEDDDERNCTQNLVTLCRDCHVKVEKILDAGLAVEFELSE